MKYPVSTWLPVPTDSDSRLNSNLVLWTKLSWYTGNYCAIAKKPRSLLTSRFSLHPFTREKRRAALFQRIHTSRALYLILQLFLCGERRQCTILLWGHVIQLNFKHTMKPKWEFTLWRRVSANCLATQRPISLRSPDGLIFLNSDFTVPIMWVYLSVCLRTLRWQSCSCWTRSQRKAFMW